MRRSVTPEMHARMQGADDEQGQRELLTIALVAAVPLWIEEMRPLTPLQRCARAEDASGIISYGESCDDLRGRHGSGPALLVIGARGKPEGAVATVFNAMAMGLAILALQPGGITHLGIHWEAK